MMYRVYLGDKDISDFVRTVRWEGSVSRYARSLEIDLKATRNNNTPAFEFGNGQVVEFWRYNVRLFTGIVFRVLITSDGSLSLTCHDRSYYLLKSTTSRTFKNKRASDILRAIASDFQVPLGTVDQTEYVIPYLKLVDNQIGDIITKAYSLEHKQTGKEYFAQTLDGKLSMRRPKDNLTPWVLARGENIVSAQYSIQIEELRNQITVTGGKDRSIKHTVSSGSSQKAYGLMTHLENMDETASASQVKQRALALLKEMNAQQDEATLTAVGISDVITGAGVYVKESMTGMLGGYYVAADTHTFSSNQHLMTLDLVRDLEMPILEVSEDELGVENT